MKKYECYPQILFFHLTLLLLFFLKTNQLSIYEYNTFASFDKNPSRQKEKNVEENVEKIFLTFCKR